MTQVCLPPGWVTENGGICAVGNTLDQNGFAVGCPDPPYIPPDPVGALLYALYDVHAGPPGYGGAQMVPYGGAPVPPNFYETIFPNVNYNLGSLYDAIGSPNHIIIPISGVYQLNYSVKIAAPQEYVFMVTAAVLNEPTGTLTETSYHPSFAPSELHGLSGVGGFSVHLTAGTDLWVGIQQQTVGVGEPDLPVESAYFSVWLLHRDAV